MAPKTIDFLLVFKAFYGGAPKLRFFTKMMEFHEIHQIPWNLVKFSEVHLISRKMEEFLHFPQFWAPVSVAKTSTFRKIPEYRGILQKIK